MCLCSNNELYTKLINNNKKKKNTCTFKKMLFYSNSIIDNIYDFKLLIETCMKYGHN